MSEKNHMQIQAERPEDVPGYQEVPDKLSEQQKTQEAFSRVLNSKDRNDLSYNEAWVEAHGVNRARDAISRENDAERAAVEAANRVLGEAVENGLVTDKEKAHEEAIEEKGERESAEQAETSPSLEQARLMAEAEKKDMDSAVSLFDSARSVLDEAKKAIADGQANPKMSLVDLAGLIGDSLTTRQKRVLELEIERIGELSEDFEGMDKSKNSILAIIELMNLPAGNRAVHEELGLDGDEQNFAILLSREFKTLKELQLPGYQRPNMTQANGRVEIKMTDVARLLSEMGQARVGNARSESESLWDEFKEKSAEIEELEAELKLGPKK